MQLKEKVYELERIIEIKELEIRELKKEVQKKKYVFESENVPREWLMKPMHEFECYGQFWEDKIIRILKR